MEDLFREDKLQFSNEINVNAHEKFNLRDLSRFFDVFTSELHQNLEPQERLKRAFEINCAKLISKQSMIKAFEIYQKHTGYKIKSSDSLILKNSAHYIEFYERVKSKFEASEMSKASIEQQSILKIDKLGTGCSIPDSPFHLTNCKVYFKHNLILLCISF